MRARGMTLLEIGIALAIVAGLIALAVPTISSVARVQLRQRTGQLAGGIRSLYGASAVAGRSCRLVMDLDASAYWSECAQGAVRLAAGGERARSGAREATREEELLATVAQRGDNNITDQERTRAELARKSAFAPTGHIPKTELGSSVRFAAVWVSHQPERYVAGKAFLYFWPSGLTETASIQLAQGDDVNTLLVEPLTGKVRIASGRVDAEGQK
jgi:general secretion pathway protein H